MKKRLIKEAFRLQQIAGIKPINEMFGSDNDQYLGKYSDIYSRVKVSEWGDYSAKDPSDKEAVRLADALTALYDEHGENGVDAWQSGAIDIEDYMDNVEEGFQQKTIIVKKDIYYVDKLGRMTSLDNVDSKYHRTGELVFRAGDTIKPDTEEYEMILNSPSLEVDNDYFYGSMNELFGNDNPDALRLGEDTIKKYFETMVEVQPDTVVNILTELLTERLPFSQFVQDTVEDIEDSYRDELS